MSVTVRHDEGTNTYELGADIEGVFIPFVSVPGDGVSAKITAAHEADEASGGGTSSGGGKVSGNSGDDFSAADFTDNGDGSYTRKSDGVQGRFTPGGFEPVTAP